MYFLLFQIEIQTKMKSIHNVIDMLTGIIGDEMSVEELKQKHKPDSLKRSKSPKDSFISDRSSPEINSKEEEPKPQYNFVHYDPEMHWCKTCDIFPKTAKEYLNHLHSNEHKATALVSFVFIFTVNLRIFYLLIFFVFFQRSEK